MMRCGKTVLSLTAIEYDEVEVHVLDLKMDMRKKGANQVLCSLHHASKADFCRIANSAL